MSTEQGPATGQRRLGSYWQRSTFLRAKAAYVVDLDELDDPPVGFARWINRAIATHCARSSVARAELAAQLDEEDKSAGSVNRSFLLDVAVIADAEDATRADRRAGRMLSLSQYVSEAARASIRAAEQRHGGPLPDAPDRLPNWPRR